MFEDLSIVIICKEEKEFVDKMLEYHPELKMSNDIIVIDSGGGLSLSKYATVYEQINLPLGRARSHAIKMAMKKYILIVDVDTELPEGFIEDAMEILKKHKDTAVVAIDYRPMLGHLNIGCSLWVTEVLKEIHDWNGNENGRCECCTCWSKVRKKGYNIETLTIGAKHYKEVNK